MLKKIELDEFFSEENKLLDNGMGIGAVGLLTPNQFINVYNYPSLNQDGELVEGLGTHEGTYMMLLNDIFNLNVENCKKGYPDKNRVLSKIPNGVNNFIQIQYIVQKSMDFITIIIPSKITNYEFDELEKFNESIKNRNLLLEVVIKNYNPIKLSNTNEEEKYYSHETALLEALKYLKQNNKVVDYELPFNEKKYFHKNTLT